MGRRYRAPAGSFFGPRSYCHWIESAGIEDTPPLAPLHGDHTADVVIVGGGYTGLSTALHIAESSPERRIVLLEAARIGYGASGRNCGLVIHRGGAKGGGGPVTVFVNGEKLARLPSGSYASVRIQPGTYSIQTEEGETKTEMPGGTWTWRAESRGFHLRAAQDGKYFLLVYRDKTRFTANPSVEVSVRGGSAEPTRVDTSMSIDQESVVPWTVELIDEGRATWMMRRYTEIRAH